MTRRKPRKTPTPKATALEFVGMIVLFWCAVGIVILAFIGLSIMLDEWARLCS